MAAVSGSTTVPCSSPTRRQMRVSSRPSGSSSSRVDPYYGHEETAKLCARFVTHLFVCPDLPPLSTAVPPAPSPPLANFIAYALHRTRLHSSVTFAALYLLQRLKARFPAARSSSGHRMFISAFMIAAKVICDDTYSNKSWTIVGQSMFALREINLMEREMCFYLEWQLKIEPDALKEFEAKVRGDFKGLGPYPTYILPSPAPSSIPSTTPHNMQADATVTIPSFAAPSQPPPSSLPPKTMPPPIPVCAAPPPTGNDPSFTPSTPDTPGSWMSDSASPATSTSPSTPVGLEDHSVGVVTSETLGSPMDVDSPLPPSVPYTHGTTSASASVAYVPARNAPAILKRAIAGDIYARASPCVW